MTACIKLNKHNMINKYEWNEMNERMMSYGEYAGRYLIIFEQ